MQECKFKVGDVVTCVSSLQTPELAVGDRYEVANIRKNEYGEFQVWVSYFNRWYTARRFELYKQPKYSPSDAKPPEVIALGGELVPTEWTDKHYDFFYKLTPQDIERGELKIDPYFVAKQWRIGSKDDSGALWHCFKAIARFGEKNTREREIKALHAQVKRLAELEGVEL